MNHVEQNDVPDHESGSESSIGGIGEPQPASFHRLKGFYQRLVDNPASLEEIFRQFRNSADRLKENGDYTRVQHRGIFEKEILQQSISELKPWLEVVVPLDPGHLGTDPVLIYLAANTLSRGQSRDDLIAISINLEEVKHVKQKTLSEIFERSRSGGYEISVLSEEERRHESVIQQIADLYERFGWSRPEVKRMLDNPNNILAVARHSGCIVSSGIGEMAVIPLQNNEFRIAEMTEAATDKIHENNGCYSAVSAIILKELASRSRAYKISGGEIDLVFGESNGLSRGVLCIAANQGRMFSTDTGDRYGFEGSGVLRQQVPISGPFRRTEYNDLIVTSLTRSELCRRY